MKKLPPIPPNCPRFEKRPGLPTCWVIRVGGVIHCIPLDDPLAPIHPDMRKASAADAEVACMEMRDTFDDESPKDAHDWMRWHALAAAWREWGEPETEEETEETK